MLDQDWVNLILDAKRLGLTIEEIRDFLDENKNNENQPKMG